MKLRHLAGLLLATTLSVFAADAAPKIAPKDAAKLVAEGKAVLVDCREAPEWAESGIAAPAVLLPKSDFDGDRKKWNEFLAKNKGKQIIIYCRAGTRAGTIAAALKAQGVEAANAGGLKDWQAAGLPVGPAPAPGTATARPEKHVPTKK